MKEVNQWVELGHLCCDNKRTPQSPIDLVKPVGGTTNMTLAVSNYKLVQRFDYADPKVGPNFSFGISAANDRLPGPSITVGADTWNLVEVHFHTRSEHRIIVSGNADPVTTDMEMHVKSTLRDNDHRYAVFTVLFQASDNGPDQLLAPILTAIANRSDPGDFHLAAALAPFGVSRFYQYTGSLTTPPCSPGVTFFVQAVPQRISASQPEAFSKALKKQFGWSENARMPQARPTPPWELRIVTPATPSP